MCCYNHPPMRSHCSCLAHALALSYDEASPRISASASLIDSSFSAASSFACFFANLRSSRFDVMFANRSASSAALMTDRRSTFSVRFASASSHRSSSVGIGGRSSMGICAGAIMRLTTWRLFLDMRQPGEMATTSPVRRLSLGSWTR